MSSNEKILVNMDAPATIRHELVEQQGPLTTSRVKRGSGPSECYKHNTPSRQGDWVTKKQSFLPTSEISTMFTIRL